MLYKYLPPERIDVIENQRIRFTPVVSLNDPFERLIKVGEHEFHVDPSVAQNCTKFMSLSRNNENILMWSHYSDCHRGFVIAFNRSHDYFRKAMSVRYRRLRSNLNGADIQKVSPETITKAVALEKAVDWAYEEEERLFLNDVSCDPVSIGTDEWGQGIILNSFPEQSVAGVFLGINASEHLTEQITKSLSGYGHKVPLYKAKTSKDKFSIRFEELP